MNDREERRERDDQPAQRGRTVRDQLSFNVPCIGQGTITFPSERHAADIIAAFRATEARMVHHAQAHNHAEHLARLRGLLAHAQRNGATIEMR